MVSTRSYTLIEEIFHSVTHGLGAVLAAVGLTALIVRAVELNDPRRFYSFIVYGASLVLLYLASTLYHAVQHEGIKRFFRSLDHLSIFILIAGSYTPVALISMGGVWGWTIFGVIWGIAAAGIVYELLFLGRHKWVTVTIYVGMGWLIVVAAKPLITAVPPGLLWWLLVGGLFYTGGVAFYVRKGMPYHHVIWHIFVLLGSASHFLGVLLYLA